MAYQKRCNYDSKVSGTICKVNVEKNNIMEFYKSPKNMYWTSMLSFSRYTLKMVLLDLPS